MRKFFPVVLALGACAALASPVSATPLLPGTTVTPTTLPSFQVGGSSADATVLNPLAAVTLDFKNSAGKTVATLREEVVKDSVTGTLDFLYQVTRTGGSDITGFSATGYHGVYTDVYQAQNVTRAANGGGVSFNSGTTPADTDTRSSLLTDDGNTIAFNLLGALASGKSTYVQIVKTNAVTYNNKGTATLSPSGISISGLLAPVPVPEPATLVLWGGICVGLLGGGIWQWRRRGAPTGSAG